MTYTVESVCAILDKLFPPSLAEPWDRVGLIAGAPEDPVHKVAFAVDPCETTVNEALERGADMLITHHPLYLRGTSTVAATTPKGSWVTRAIRAQLALFSAHTNADVLASTKALADIVGMDVERPLDEESGIGGVGTLREPMALKALVEKFADGLPKVPAGLLASGNPDQLITRLAISSGSGDSFLASANASGADAYFTADLRHHPATDHIWGGGCALICATHFASEWPLLKVMEERLLGELPELDTYISTLSTDAWNIAVRG